MGRTCSRIGWAVALLLGIGFHLPALADEPTPDDLQFFEAKVRPLLVERCYQCHSADAKRIRGNLLLDTKDGWTEGGDNGPTIVPGDPENSLLVQVVRYDDIIQMPPKGKLPDAEIAILTEWVRRARPTPAPARPALSLRGRSTSKPGGNTGRFSR